MKRGRTGAFALALLMVALVAACDGGTARQGGVILVFDSNLRPPRDFDAIHVEIRHGGPEPIYDNDSPVKSLPQTFGVFAGGDLTVPVVIHTVALLRGQPRVTRDARTLVPRDRVVSLPMYFDAVCIGIVCLDDLTCNAGVCNDDDVDSDELPDYTPAPASDAGCAASCGADAGTSRGGIDVAAGPIVVQQGHAASVDVAIARKDERGDVAVTVAGLPDGVTADPLTIPSGARSGPLTLHASATATAGPGAQVSIAARDDANGRDGATQVPLTVTPGGSGRVDSAFGVAGHSVIPAAQATIAAIRAAAGQIVVAGSTRSGSGEAFVARLDPGGAPVAGFGQGGVAVASAAGAEVVGRALAVDANGSAVVAGRIDDGTSKQLLVARFGASGLDASFHGSGLATASFGGVDVAGNAVAFDDAANVVVAGEAAPSGGDGAPRDTVLARFAPDGAADGSYTRVIDLGAGGVDFATALVAEPGRMVVGGVVAGSSGDTAFLLAGFDAKGDPDPSFGGGKIASVGFGGATRLAALLVSPSAGAGAGGLLAAGRAAAQVPATDLVGVVTSALDGSGAASRSLSSPFGAFTTSAARDGRGRLVTAGVASFADGPGCVVSRFAPALDAPDPAFVTYTQATAQGAQTCAVAIDDDDAVLVAATGLAGEIVVTRLLP